MKFICLTVWLTLLSVVSAAQTGPISSGASGLDVIEKKWRAEIQYRLLAKDPLLHINNRQNEVREIIEVKRQNELRAEAGLPPLPPPVRKPTVDTGPLGPSVEHIYEVRFKNIGKKTVHKVVWEYVFFEKGTDKEVGRRYFESEVVIRPGRSKKVVEMVGFSPTSTVDATNDTEKPEGGYGELIEIRSVQHSDASIWLAPKKPN